MKRFLAYVLIIGASIVSLAIVTGHSYLFDGIRQSYFRGWRNANIDDFQFKVDSRRVGADSPKPWPLSEGFGSRDLSESALERMNEDYTASFLVIHRDSLLFEKYWRGHDKGTISNSFSIAKSIVAIAVGLIVDDGLIDIGAPVSKYLPRFKDGLGSKLTVEHLLQMRSNIPFGEDYKNPFGFQARAYYGPNILGLLNPYRPESEPGTVWHYQGGNTMLLAEIISKVQDLPLATLVGSRVWTPMGAVMDARWGLDGIDGTERCFAQFYATSRDFARFGKLLLDSGVYDGNRIISSDYIAKMLAPVSATTSLNDINHYGYQIWLGTTDSGYKFSILEGLRGQCVISIPSLDLIIVRTGYANSRKKKRNIPVDVYLYIKSALNIARL